MLALEEKNSNLISYIQEKETTIGQLKHQIQSYTRSLVENQERMANESDAIMHEKRECMRRIIERKNNLENLELKIVQTRDESEISSIDESRKRNELTHSLEKSHFENDRLKEKVALMRKEMKLLSNRPLQPPKLDFLGGSCVNQGTEGKCTYNFYYRYNILFTIYQISNF